MLTAAPPAPPLPAAPAYQRVKLQRAEPAPIKTLPGLFATVLYVDNLQLVSGCGVCCVPLGWVCS